jgi:hypothetical protein
MIPMDSKTLNYTVLFGQLGEVHSGLDVEDQAEMERVLAESEQIRVLREIVEAASEQSETVVFTRG